MGRAQDDLLDELQNDYEVVFVERELPAPIDMIVDERNGISLLHRGVFEGTTSSAEYLERLDHYVTYLRVRVSADNQRMRSLILQLAQQQIQYDRVWMILHGEKSQVCPKSRDATVVLIKLCGAVIGDAAQEELQLFYSALINFRINVTLLSRYARICNCFL